MKKKMIVAAALLVAVSLAIFANPVMYVKGALRLRCPLWKVVGF